MAKIKAVWEHKTESESAVCNTGINVYEQNWLKKNHKIHGAFACGPQGSAGFFHGSSHYSFYCFTNKKGNTEIDKQKEKNMLMLPAVKMIFFKRPFYQKRAFQSTFWLICTWRKTHFVDTKIETNWLH